MKKHLKTITTTLYIIMFICIATYAGASDRISKQIEVTYIGKSHNLLLFKPDRTNVYHKQPKQKIRRLRMSEKPGKYIDNDSTMFNMNMFVKKSFDDNKISARYIRH